MINPAYEQGTVTSVAGGVAIANVLTNDSTNGYPSTNGTNSTIVPSGTWPTGISLDTATGAVIVVPGTTPGAYASELSVV